MRCRNLLTMQRQKLIISNHAQSLEQKVREATEQVQLCELETLNRLAKAGEFKGKITGRNLMRMGEISYLIAEKIGLDPEHRKKLKVSSTMHDIGKIGIPDNILLKQGPLEDNEFEIMKRHPRSAMRFSRTAAHLLSKWALSLRFITTRNLTAADIREAFKAMKFP